MNRAGKSKAAASRRMLSFVLVFVLAWMSCPLAGVRAAKKTPPREPKTQKAVLRVISTTDLHGQVSTTHYDTASEKPGSLAQVYTLIKQARQEAGSGNTLTVDTGDSVYGYAADYILDKSGENTVQPIYKAMAMVNYDAIALGNHDFDYGYAYIDKQLELSGLKKKCVLSNIIRADTGQTAWEESKMITKKLKTDAGKSVIVEVGVIGITIPSMSSYSNCKEDLIALPIVSTVEKQAASLKSQGADFVVVIAHSSMGSANPAEDSDNAVYALTKLENVDAIAAGHGHKNYPSSDKASASYYNLPNVDKKTGLMNGKPVTMIKDHGAGMGVIDLNLEIDEDGEIAITGSSAELRMVTKDTPSSMAIVEAQQPEISAVDESLKEVVGTLAADEKINSYFALLEDNYAIQLVNESKLQYGLAYTGGAGKLNYGSCPVVATTKYTLSGSQSAEDNISLNGSITMKDILNMQQDNHNNNTLYWVTGAQLRELLEWSASVYTAADGSISSDEVLEQMLAERGASSIAASDWLDDWSAFAVFDGIEYTIDATRQPRYSKAGDLKNSYSQRIVSLTHNGQPVMDDQKLILVSHTVASNVDATGTISQQKVLGKSDLAYVHLINFIKQQQKFGDLKSDTDHNWNVVFDADREYIVRASIFSQTDAMMKDWFQGLVNSSENFAYYLAKFVQAEKPDTAVPLLIVSPVVTVPTDQPVEIKVQASDRSGIRPLKWAKGQETADSTVWETAQEVISGSFTAEENGIYSVLAEDSYGNKVVRYAEIANIDPDMVQVPTINKVSNKASVVTGTARPGTTVHVDADGTTYEAEVAADGTYTCTIERLAAGRTISAYCTDEKGRRSDMVSITVFKNGPDMPVIDPVSNKSLKVTGRYSGTSAAVVAIAGTNVYCSAADKTLYEKSDLYSKSRQLVIVESVVNGNQFELSIPVQNAGVSLKFVTLDKAGRRSATAIVETADEAPNVPVVQEACDLEDYIYGQVTNVKESGTVTVTAGGRQYSGEIQADGTFAVQTDGFTAGQEVLVAANDVKDGTPRTSLAAVISVKSNTEYTAMSDTSLQPVYSNSLQIKGHTLSYYQINVVVRGKSTRVTPDSIGDFTHTLTEPLMAGEKVYVVARHEGKIAEIAEETVTEYTQPSVPEVPSVPETPSVPEMPSVLTSSITLSTQQIDVLAKEMGTVVMSVDGMDYTSQFGVYNQSYGGYIYTLQLPSASAQQTISIRFINQNGVSSNSVTVMRTNNYE